MDSFFSLLNLAKNPTNKDGFFTCDISEKFATGLAKPSAGVSPETTWVGAALFSLNLEKNPASKDGFVPPRDAGEGFAADGGLSLASFLGLAKKLVARARDGFFIVGGAEKAGVDTGAPRSRNDGLSSFFNSQSASNMPTKEIPTNIKNIVTGYS